MRIARRLVLALLLLGAVGAFAAFVWPTLYRYDHISTNGDTYPVRINRLNGEADMLVPDEGWVPVEGDAGGGQGEPDTQKTGAARARASSGGSALTAETPAPIRLPRARAAIFAFPPGRAAARMT